MYSLSLVLILLTFWNEKIPCVPLKVHLIPYVPLNFSLDPFHGLSASWPSYEKVYFALWYKQAYKLMEYIVGA